MAWKLRLQHLRGLEAVYTFSNEDLLLQTPFDTILGWEYSLQVLSFKDSLLSLQLTRRKGQVSQTDIQTISKDQDVLFFKDEFIAHRLL